MLDCKAVHAYVWMWATYHGAAAAMLLPSLAATAQPLVKELMATTTTHGGGGAVVSHAGACALELLTGRGGTGARTACSELTSALADMQARAQRVLAAVQGSHDAPQGGVGALGSSSAVARWLQARLLEDDGAWLLAAALHCALLAWRVRGCCTASTTGCPAGMPAPALFAGGSAKGTTGLRGGALVHGLVYGLWGGSVLLVMGAMLHAPYLAFRLQGMLAALHGGLLLLLLLRA